MDLVDYTDQPHSEESKRSVQSRPLSTISADNFAVYEGPEWEDRKNRTRSTGTMHTSAKARLASVAIRIRIRDPDCHQNLIICSSAHCQPSTQLNSTSIYGRRCKTPQCPHLSSHYCISNTTINLFRVLICRRFRSGWPQNHI